MSLFTKLLGSKYPIMQAPMAGVTTASFVSEVCKTGAIGSHGCAMLTPDQISADIKLIRSEIGHNTPFCINLFVLPKPPKPSMESLSSITKKLDKYYQELNIPQPKSYDKYGENFEDQFETILQAAPPIFSFCFGALSEKQIVVLKKRDIIVIGTATNITEAHYLSEIGCNMIIAQGAEAGGHRSTFFGDFKDSLIGSMSLIPSIIDVIENKTPVIAAGGIMDGRAMDAAFSLGACGVSMGTVFMNCKECEIPSCYKQILRDTAFNQITSVTDKFSGRPARGIHNRFMTEMDQISEDIPPYPVMNKLTTAMRAEAKKQCKTDLMSLWCGSGAPLIEKYEYRISAKDLVERIVKESSIHN